LGISYRNLKYLIIFIVFVPHVDGDVREETEFNDIL